VLDGTYCQVIASEKYEAMRRVSWQTRLEAYVFPGTKQKQIKFDGSSEHTPNRVTPYQSQRATGHRYATPQINLEN
jgi:hypothetical protein